jgi:solute carrier family 50 protein (sugar transporter)
MSTDSSTNFLGTFVPVLATVFSIGVGASPYKTILEIKAVGDPKGYSFFPFFALLMNSLFAGFYGLMIYNSTLIFVNILNAMMASYYVYVYYLVSKEQPKLRWIMMGAAALSLLIAYHITSRTTPEDGRFQAGLISNVAGILMFASPLATLKTVLATKNASSIPLLLSFAAFLCSATWLLYGVMLWDPFIACPNAFGLVLAIIQLGLVATYGQKGSKGPILPTVVNLKQKGPLSHAHSSPIMQGEDSLDVELDFVDFSSKKDVGGKKLKSEKETL